MKNDLTQIERINEELLFMQKTLLNVDKENFLINEIIQHAIAMSLITIGECANHLSEQFKKKHSDVEWFQIIGVRNYWQLSMEQIWQAVISDIPEFKKFITSILR